MHISFSFQLSVYCFEWMLKEVKIPVLDAFLLNRMKGISFNQLCKKLKQSPIQIRISSYLILHCIVSFF